MRRLILAAMLGAAAAAVALFAAVEMSDDGPLAMLQTLYDLANSIQVFGFLLLFLLAFGAVPAILICAVLMFLRIGTPLRLVLAPAILFALVLLEVARETHEAALIATTLPAMAIGGLTMFWVLSRKKDERPIDAVFE